MRSFIFNFQALHSANNNIIINRLLYEKKKIEITNK